MQYHQMGKSGIRVSELCLGTMNFGGRGSWAALGSVNRATATRMIGICLQAGINFFDTADIYSEGLSEEILGEAIGSHRSEVIITTKVRGRMGKNVNDVGLSRWHIIRAVEQSLTRLGTDWIDLYQIHGWDENTPLDETLFALDHLVQSGKVRYIGCSNFSGWQLEKAIMLSQINGWSGFVTFQGLYNLVHRDLELELMPVCVEEGLGILPWSPLAGGFLTGKYRRGKPRPRFARRSDPDTAFLPIDEERGFDIIEELDRLSSAHNGTVAQGALNWIKAKQNICSTIIGARTIDQLEENLRSVSWQFTDDEISRLDE
ncbi:MAG TPA: aldo/keto reductase, partial [Bacteroidetes bacterium]|nr:aldo/keto reductase [Bacteroidota bacterium]